MTISQQLHRSKGHCTGFDPNCPHCIKSEGIDGIIEHLTKCAAQNERDAKNSAGFCERNCAAAASVAAEQRRMIGILRLYRMHVVMEA